MNRSEQINELAAALAKAQGQMPAIKKDKTADIPTKAGGRYSYNYADLATIMEAIRQPLADNGLALIQTVETGDRLVAVETMLAHTSGQWISHQIGLSVDGDIRAIGSAITYGRRYGIVLTGVVTEEDDDGESASRGNGHEAAAAPRRQPPTQADQKCPKCGGAMWDNRTSKTNPKAPDYKCKNKECGHGVWVDADLPADLPPADDANWEDLQGHSEQAAPKVQPSGKPQKAFLAVPDFGARLVELLDRLTAQGVPIPTSIRKADGGIEYDAILFRLGNHKAADGSIPFARITPQNIQGVLDYLEMRIIEKAQPAPVGK